MTAASSHSSITNAVAPPGWVSMLKLPVLVRAFAVALILGSILTAINQPEAVFGTLTLDLLPLTLVYITPFAVVTLSQILGIRQALREGKPLPDGENFLATMVAHGIPPKAVLTGLLAGTLNTSITLFVALIGTGSLADVPIPLLVQAYCLPVLFGLLSQAISYRRASARLEPQSAV